MRCSKAQARVNASRRGLADDATDRSVREHLAECAACSDLERARNLIVEDLEAVAADAGEEPMDFGKLRRNTPDRLESDTTTSGRRQSRSFVRRYAVPAAAVVFALVIAIVSSQFRVSDRDYEITVAGIDESMLMSGSLERLFTAVGLPDLKIESQGCNPLCLLKIVGLHNLDDTKLAVAALQSVPSAKIEAVGDYADKNTGMTVTRTTTTTSLDITKDRWAMELQIDSTDYHKVTLALDSLKQDTTFTIGWPSNTKEPIPEMQEDYTVHPDGSYSTTLHALPGAHAGWTEDIYTFDSTGMLLGHTMVDTTGVVHEIDTRNWAKAEEQFKALGIYRMITYDQDGTPFYTGTNVDPTTLPGYGPRLAPGMVLEQNEPNPFDTLTNITFKLPEKARVKFMIYNMNSKLVRTLIDSTMAAGKHTVTWHGRSDEGKRVWSLVYLGKLQVGEYYHTINMYQTW